MASSGPQPKHIQPKSGMFEEMEILISKTALFVRNGYETVRIIKGWTPPANDYGMKKGPNFNMLLRLQDGGFRIAECLGTEI
jgi:hypothetical protein